MAGRPARRSRPAPESRSGRPARHPFAAARREPERAPIDRPAAPPATAPSPALRSPAELQHPSASGETREPPTHPERRWSSDPEYRTSVRYRQRRDRAEPSGKRDRDEAAPDPRQTEPLIRPQPLAPDRDGDED